MELVKRLTAQAVTPSTPFTAFSTRALQAAQLMPVTSYCFIDILVSFDIVMLITRIEEEFDVVIPAKDITPAHFNSAKSLYALIASLEEQDD